METFFILFFKVIPLYALILLGFTIGKYLKLSKDTLTTILIFVISPVVIFNGLLITHLSFSILTLPVIFFLVSCFMCLVFYIVASKIWTNSTKNILAFTSGTGNTGYFGLPVAIALLGENISGLVIMCVLGVVLFENSLGYYITARGNFTAKQSVIKLLKLPTLYACIVGVIVNLLGINLGQTYFEYASYFKGAYILLGMMIISIAISNISINSIDLKFLSLSFLAKFIIWPVMIAIIIFFDKNIFHMYSNEIYKVMIIMSVVPLAANTVSLATLLNAQPEKASLAVLLSTIFALGYIPLIAFIFLR